MMRTTSLFILSVTLVACGTELPPPPENLDPLDEVNEAPLPQPDANGVYPEEFNVIGAKEDDWSYAHGRGYIRRPTTLVWAALRDPEVTIDRRKVKEWTITRDIAPAFSASWRSLNVVHSHGFTIEFETEWYIHPFEGSLEDPEIIKGLGRKVAGTSFISRLEDSVVLRKIDDNVTLIELQRHTSAALSTEKEDPQYLQDVYESLRERSYGRPIPVWN